MSSFLRTRVEHASKVLTTRNSELPPPPIEKVHFMKKPENEKVHIHPRFTILNQVFLKKRPSMTRIR